MTAYPPYGGPPSHGFRPNDDYTYQQPPEASYPQYDSGGYAYGQSQREPPQYASNPPESAPSYGEPQAYPSYPSPAVYSTQALPSAPYSQEYQNPTESWQQPVKQEYDTSDVDALRSHFESTLHTGDQAPPGSGPTAPQVPAGWEARFNQQYQEWFYVNTVTKQSQWEKPVMSTYPLHDASAPPGPPPSDEQDKGFMGAVAGGAAGAYGGHKIHHGFLGAIGGAVVGSKLEDAYKDHKKDEKKDKKKHGWSRRSSSSSSSSIHAPPIIAAPPMQSHQQQPPVSVMGNFHASSRKVSLDADNNLIAECQRSNGSWKWDSIDLNDCLTNTNGEFHWAKGGNAFGSARRPRLIEGGNAVEAELGDGRGGWKTSRIWLNEKIENNNGELRLL